MKKRNGIGDYTIGFPFNIFMKRINQIIDNDQ